MRTNRRTGHKINNTVNCNPRLTRITYILCNSNQAITFTFYIIGTTSTPINIGLHIVSGVSISSKKKNNKKQKSIKKKKLINTRKRLRERQRCEILKKKLMRVSSFLIILHRVVFRKKKKVKKKKEIQRVANKKRLARCRS